MAVVLHTPGIDPPVPAEPDAEPLEITAAMLAMSDRMHCLCWLRGYQTGLEDADEEDGGYALAWAFVIAFAAFVGGVGGFVLKGIL